MGRYNLWDALTTVRRQDLQSLRTHPTHRPREDIFLPKQNSLSPCRHFFVFFRVALAQAALRTVLPARCRLTQLGPRPINPHPAQNHGEATGDGDDGSTYPAPLSHPHAPRLQPRPFLGAGKHSLCCLVEHRAQQGIATFGYTAIIVDLAGLVALRRQTDMRADGSRMNEPLRLTMKTMGRARPVLLLC